jgi:subtilase family serine protease
MQLCMLLTVALFSSLSYAAAPDRIPGVIDSSQMVELRNHVSPLARPQFDQGPVETSRMMHVSMLFLPTAEQKQALTTLIAEQQDKKSANYHQWLSAAKYADQFGLSPSDIGKVKAWLAAQGFKVTYVANGRDYISFQGTAGQVQSVFRTQIHNYNVKGKMHFANVTPPMIPAALNGIVGGFRGLHNFLPHSMLRQRPNYTFTDNNEPYHAIAPGDLATIYNITPLYSSSINGAGVNVVVAGQSDVYLADINYFRGAFGLTQLSGCTLDSTKTILQAGKCTAGNFQQVWPEGSDGDPKVVSGDLSESDLDLETLSGVAPGAEIVFVTSAYGVDDSVSYAVDEELGTVISYSYGACEALVSGGGDIATSESTYEKAVSEGISMFAASGDSASAICDEEVGSGEEPAIYGASVSYPASSAYVTGVGGTEFDEGSGSYWGSASENGASGGSALSYIPETGWNDTALTGDPASFDGTGGGPSNCAYESSSTAVGEYAFAICKPSPDGGFTKPTWQSSVTPSDGVRDVPDIAFSGSNFNDPYIVCTPLSELDDGSSSSTSSCSPGGTTGINNALTLTPHASAFGGTSAPTPVAAGMAALLNQYMSASGLGLFNTQLYELFSTNPSGVFNDINSGTNSVTGGASSNVVTCTAGTPSFETSTTVVCPSTGEIGFTVSGGHTYSEVTGVGSVNMNEFMTAWAAAEKGFTMSAGSSSITVQQGDQQNITINTAVVDGFSGTISFACSGLPTGASCSFNPTSVTAGSSTTLTVTTTGLGTAQMKGSPRSRTLGWLGGAVLPVFGICLVGFSVQGRRRGIFATLTVLVLVGTLLSCGGSSSTTTTSNPVPSISSLSPTEQAAGSQAQILTINGSNFIAGSTVTYNGVAHTATYVSATQLTTTLPASDLLTTGQYPVVVTNPTPGGGSSSAVNFDVVSGTPAGSFTVTVTGTSGTASQTASFTLTVQ